MGQEALGDVLDLNDFKSKTEPESLLELLDPYEYFFD